ncbi:transcriptional regulatory protein Rxt3 [Schizosaccharomyces cryophilus OY26]|uniref:Transcriptional regulatory protein Rxt3 n=1 Tax=Schizosaccharomyces cryophilus (strain OY26 / ATCC MYA-4695 / CBS 11777 / NBRC 106824 / NRRL Y48691) TaxID=653667 RepID=S9VU61_SCHCR|nr:transcriptional regulatory protein Rxt3 [Schizosaccharomyces cryophilus OY26]EPY49724.1 transcriptional regulatory protein Rxt3 [Schizosaccharomyces cryophilus OY26]
MENQQSTQPASKEQHQETSNENSMQRTPKTEKVGFSVLSIGSILENPQSPKSPETITSHQSEIESAHTEAVPMATSTPTSSEKRPINSPTSSSHSEKKTKVEGEQGKPEDEKKSLQQFSGTGEPTAAFTSHQGAPTGSPVIPGSTPWPYSSSAYGAPQSYDGVSKLSYAYSQIPVRQFVSPPIDIDNSALDTFLETCLSSGNEPVAQFVYTPWFELPLLYNAIGKFIRIEIDAKWLNAAINPRLSKREIWGTDVYTDDSDIVTILAHCGYFSLFKPLTKIAVVDLFILPPLIGYKGTRKNQIESRSWTSRQDGVSLKVKNHEWKSPEPTVFETAMHNMTLEQRLQARLELSRSSVFKI